MSKLIVIEKALKEVLSLTETELHMVCNVYDEDFDEKTFDRLRKIHRYLEKSIKIAEGKKRNVKN